MKRAIDDQHRTRLRRVSTNGWIGGKCAAFDDARSIAGQTQHAIWQKAEISRPRPRDDARNLLAVFDIKPHRAAIRVIHACIHRECNFATFF